MKLSIYHIFIFVKLIRKELEKKRQGKIIGEFQSPKIFKCEQSIQGYSRTTNGEFQNKGYKMITQDKMLAVFKRAVKGFGEDPSMEKIRVSYKLDDVEKYNREFNRNDYENSSIQFSRIYSEIEQIRRQNEIKL